MESELQFIKYAISMNALFLGVIISMVINIHAKLNILKDKLDKMDEKDN